jgi:hypothetical protein
VLREGTAVGDAASAPLTALLVFPVISVFTGKIDYLSGLLTRSIVNNPLFPANRTPKFPARGTGNSVHWNREVTGGKQATSKW